jgi:hypothetical protein
LHVEFRPSCGPIAKAAGNAYALELVSNRSLPAKRGAILLVPAESVYERCWRHFTPQVGWLFHPLGTDRRADGCPEQASEATLALQRTIIWVTGSLDRADRSFAARSVRLAGTSSEMFEGRLKGLIRLERGDGPIQLNWAAVSQVAASTPCRGKGGAQPSG